MPPADAAATRSVLAGDGGVRGGLASLGGAEMRPSWEPMVCTRTKYIRLAPEALLPPSLTCLGVRNAWETARKCRGGGA